MYKSIFLRLLTALVGIPFVVGMLYLGSWPFVLFVLALALLCQHEVYRLLEEGGLHPHRIPGLLIGALLVLQAAWRPGLYVAAAVVVGVVACFPFYSGLSGREGAQTRVSACACGVAEEDMGRCYRRRVRGACGSGLVSGIRV